MKKIFLALAAVAALASCVKENTLVPEQTADNLVTITAVSADTKTTLDGVNVLWEENDEIAVVVEGVSVKYLETFTTSSTEKASTAEFTAVLSDELAADGTVTGIGYAVYPAASATYAAGNVSIAHELPEEQTGTITKGMNLSYAKVEADDIKAGKANAVFSNALTLLKVNVPDGVKSVVLESDIMSPALVGTVNFTVNKTVDNISFVKGGAVSTKRTVTLSNGGAKLEEGVHDLLVFPGTANELTLTMTGMDDAVYESTLNGVEFVAGTYRTINLTNVFKMGVKDVEVVSPMGGTFDYEVVATAQYDYKVAIEGDPTWIRLNENEHVTKTFVGTKVSFDVDANTSGSPREANVTISWNNGEPQSKSFVITQESAYLDFVYVDPADPASGLIQWEETFGVFSDEDLTTNVKDFTNTFTIDLSDDPSKGTYVLENLFVYDKSGSKVGGTYYADFNSTENELTVYTSTAAAPSCTYYFDDTVVLVYNPSTKTFSSKLTAFKANTKYDFSGYANKDAFIGNYEAHHYVAPDPGVDDDSPLSAFIGTWSESFTNTYFMGAGDYANDQTVSVSVDGDKLLVENMIKIDFYGSPYAGSYYGTLSADGKTITLEDVNSSSGHKAFGPLQYQSQTTIELTVGTGTLTCASTYGGYIVNYQLFNKQ